MKYVKEQQKVVKFLRTQHSRDYINPIVEQASPYWLGEEQHFFKYETKSIDSNTPINIINNQDIDYLSGISLQSLINL